jgi:hypothetical protein
MTYISAACARFESTGIGGEAIQVYTNVMHGREVLSESLAHVQAFEEKKLDIVQIYMIKGQDDCDLRSQHAI